MSEDTQPTTDTTTEQSSPPVQLALNDISAAVEIIDAAATRGAFRGEELSRVGGVRDRLAVFLKAHLPPTAEEKEAEEVDPEAGKDE